MNPSWTSPPKKVSNPYASSAPGTVSSMSSFASNSTRAAPPQRAQAVSPILRPNNNRNNNNSNSNSNSNSGWGRSNVSASAGASNNDDSWGKGARDSGPNGWGAYENRFDGWRPTLRDDQVRRDPVERQFKNSSSSNNNNKSKSNNNNNNNNNNKSNSKKRPWTDKNTVTSKYAGGNNSNINQKAKPFNPQSFKKSLKHATLEDPKKYFSEFGLPDDIFSSSEHPQLLQLNERQRSILTLTLFQRVSVFFTGPAGSGKSLVVKSLLYLNSKISKPKKIAVTATTGIAACALGGTTINSFFGIGLGDGSCADMVKRVMKNEHVKAKINSTDFLVIDEVSMMEGEMFDKLDEVAKKVRANNEPFGGLVLILTGDFYQLPPIKVERGYAFQSDCWNNVIGRSVVLDEVYRSGGDPVLVKILDEARVGTLSADSIKKLRNHESNPPRPVTPKSGVRIENTRLECKNRNVDSGNDTALSRLQGSPRTYVASDDEGGYAGGLLRNMTAPESLTLKLGAQVMLLKNLDTERGLCNGSRGVVTSFLPWSSAVSEYSNDKDIILPQGWARNIEVPVVAFAGPSSTSSSSSSNCLEVPILPTTWEVSENDRVIASRTQVPLKLAWVLSVHKSQGQTISNLSVNLRDVFEVGQAYVALSRGVCMDNLVVEGFREGVFRASNVVKVFYGCLEGGGEKKEGGKFIPTEEQKRRMEENRRRAIELRKERERLKA